jgi:hypothetical protein
MKKKFEANVAAEVPKTKLHEPQLPWKFTEDEAAPAASGDGDLKSAMSPTPTLATRASFLILLVITIFGVTAYLISSAVMENGKIRSSMARKDGELSLAQLNLMKAVAQKEIINKNSAQLEKKVSDLTAQKELFASVIESLTKKGEDIDAPTASLLTAATASQTAQGNTANTMPQAGANR